MTISPVRSGVPESIDEQTRMFDGRQDERCDERQGPTSLAVRILSSWSYTCRLILLVIMTVGALVTALLLLQADLAIGPVQISRR